MQTPAGLTARVKGNGYQLFADHISDPREERLLTRFAQQLRSQGWTVKNTGRAWFKVAYPPQA